MTSKTSGSACTIASAVSGVNAERPLNAPTSMAPVAATSSSAPEPEPPSKYTDAVPRTYKNATRGTDA